MILFNFICILMQKDSFNSLFKNRMNRNDWIKKLMWYVEAMQKEWINICWPQLQQYDLLEMCLISKHYWLIKWLVEKGKIDYYLVWKKLKHCLWFYRDDEILLMTLSISDTPIEDLISYLK